MARHFNVDGEQYFAERASPPSQEDAARVAATATAAAAAEERRQAFLVGVSMERYEGVTYYMARCACGRWTSDKEDAITAYLSR